jgi:hypothetical protein
MTPSSEDKRRRRHASKIQIDRQADMREISKTTKRLLVIHQNRRVIKANFENPSIGSKRHCGTIFFLQKQSSCSRQFPWASLRTVRSKMFPFIATKIFVETGRQQPTAIHETGLNWSFCFHGASSDTLIVGDKKQAVHVVYIFKTRLNQLEEHYTSKIHQQITPCRKKKKKRSWSSSNQRLRTYFGHEDHESVKILLAS